MHGHIRSAVFNILDPLIPVIIAHFVAYRWSAWPGLVLACHFLWWHFLCRFDSESDSDSGGSICSRGVSTPFPTHQVQAVSLLHFRDVDCSRGCLFAKFVHLPTRWILRRNSVPEEMEESIRRVLVLYRLPITILYSAYIHPCDNISHSLLHHPHQAQDTGTPRWTVCEHSAT